jgi:BCD family chlorophyll transporter-like MFS transporter
LLWPVQANVFLMGIGNGVLTIAVIGHMMRHASEGGASREGLRIGLWGAAQALALALGSLAGALASDLARTLLPSGGAAYGVVFALAGLVFIVSARLAWRLSDVAALRS